MRLKHYLELGAAVLTAVVSTARSEELDRSHHPCPRSCADALKQTDWSSLYSAADLATCAERTIFTLNAFTPVDDPSRQFRIRICTTGDADTVINGITGTPPAREVLALGSGPGHAANDASVGRIARRDEDDDLDGEDINSSPPKCHEAPMTNATMTNATAHWMTWNIQGGPAKSNKRIISSFKDTQAFLKNPLNCDETVIYGYFQGALVGVHVGRRIQNSAAASGFVQDFIDRLGSSSSSSTQRTVAQVCGDGRNADYHLGVVADPSGDLAWVQGVIRSWSEARCVDRSASEGHHTAEKRASLIPAIGPAVMLKSRLVSRGASGCQRIQAAYGDTLESLASTCNIGTAELRRYNNHLPAAWKPEPFQWVCCSAGGLGLLSKRAAPNPRPDGSCVSYLTVSQDSCSKIALTYGITMDEIYTYNKETWGWGGCDNLFPGYRICIGPGTPRLPAPNPDAECGPSKPGTKSPANGEKIEDLSPCNIKACCNVWGKCGVDSDHCVPTESETGNAGTAAPRTNGCVQNCGMDMVTGAPPATFMKVAYFESWNHERPCLHMSVSQIPSGYTHVHYSFADITESFGVSTGRFTDVFNEFKAMRGPKRIVAFGGWAFSTEPATYQLFRNAVKAGNREAFANACVDFVLSNGLDGVDFDWEYPAEPDIPGIPAGDPSETGDYLELVKVVRAKMPADKTVSIAAPASYWYLKQFLIEEMSHYVDYIIYMTYDLHGQWDYGSKWSQPGCPGGNCLRSHVNMTETMNSLIMITKAGVPSNKVVVGVTSYGRSFQMTSSSCEGPMCTYTGPESGAEPGKCTGTGGYISNGEIKALIAEERVSRQWKDKTESDYIQYDDNWVAYMDDANKAARTEKYRSLNFAGTTDWAVDLQGDVGGISRVSVVYLATEVYSGTPAQCTAPCLFVFPSSALPSATTLSLPAYTSSIIVGEGTDRTTITVTVRPPAITTNSMGFFNMNVTSGQESESSGLLVPTVSIQVPPVVTTVTINGGLIFTRTLYLPPWPLITLGPPPSGGWTNDTPPWQTDGPGGGSGGSYPPPAWPPIHPPDTRTWPDVEPPTPTGDPTPIWPPSWEIEPVDEDIDDDGEDDDGDGPKHKSSCKLWFFGICIKWEGIHIGGWDWNMPPGIWGPGPPPIRNIKLPPNIRIDGTLPPWPRITIGPGGKPTFPPKPADCTPTRASLCMTTSSFGTTLSNGVTRTTATQVKSTCATITGCQLKDGDATKTGYACDIRPTPGALGRRDRDWWDCDDKVGDAIVLPRKPDDETQIDRIRALLDERKSVLGDEAGHYEEFTAPDLGFTAYFFLRKMGQKAHFYLNSEEVPEVHRAYYFEYENWQRSNGFEVQENPPKIPPESFWTGPIWNQRRDSGSVNSTRQSRPPSHAPKSKRGSETDSKWHLGQLSVPPKEVFQQNGPHTYDFDDSLGQGQTIFILDDGFQDIPSEFGGNVDSVLLRTYGHPPDETVDHGTLVAAFAGGQTLGVARNARLVHVQTPHELDFRWPIERFLEALVNVANRCIGTEHSTVVNMSWGIRLDDADVHVWKIMLWLMQAMETKYGTMFVVAAGNDGLPVMDMPAIYQGQAADLPNMIVVGGSAKDGKKTPKSNHGNLLTLFAPGMDLPYPEGWPFEKQEGGAYGTSFAAPIVSGLVAYIRAHPGMGVSSPGAVRQKIVQLSRRITPNPPAQGNWPAEMIAWNGQAGSKSCGGTGPEPNRRRQEEGDDDSCPLPGQPGNGGGNGPAPTGPPITFRPGPPSPTCTASCGTLCSGYFCRPDAPGPAPDATGPPPGPGGGLGPGITGTLPNLPSDPTPIRPCLSSTTVTQCNGGPRGAACITSTSCVSFGSLTGLPTLPPDPNNPTTPGGGATCVSSTTWTELGGPKFEATITKSSCARWATPTPDPPKPTRDPKPPAKEKVISIMRENTLDGSGSSFAIFAVLGGLDPCDHDPVSSQGFGTWSLPTPPNLHEKFSAYGYNGITYERGPESDGGLGFLHVPGRWGEQDGPVKCQWDPEQGKRHKCPLFIEYWRQIRCVWDD